MISYKERLNSITTFIFDIDGVLTDGVVYPYHGELLRGLYSKDGYAIQLAIKKGYKVWIISGGYSEEVQERLEKLGKLNELCVEDDGNGARLPLSSLSPCL